MTITISFDSAESMEEYVNRNKSVLLGKTDIITALEKDINELKCRNNELQDWKDRNIGSLTEAGQVREMLKQLFRSYPKICRNTLKKYYNEGHMLWFIRRLFDWTLEDSRKWVETEDLEYEIKTDFQ